MAQDKKSSRAPHEVVGVRCTDNCSNWHKYAWQLNITVALDNMKGAPDMARCEYCPWCGADLEYASEKDLVEPSS